MHWCNANEDTRAYKAPPSKEQVVAWCFGPCSPFPVWEAAKDRYEHTVNKCMEVRGAISGECCIFTESMGEYE